MKYGVIAFIIASCPDIGFMIGKIDMRIERKKNMLTTITAMIRNSILYDGVNFIRSGSFASVIGKYGE